jgi:ADP-heptose:LPS heptosyltransferase
MAEMAGIDPTRVLAGRTSLLDLVALVASANMVVCGDTGVAHVATAVGTPSVVLFGPVAPSEWGPPRNHPRHRALWAGRNGDPHGRSVDPGLLSIDVDDVLGAMATARIQAASETR